MVPERRRHGVGCERSGGILSGGPETVTSRHPGCRESSARNSSIARVSPAIVRTVAPEIGRVTALASMSPFADKEHAAHAALPEAPACGRAGRLSNPLIVRPR